MVGWDPHPTSCSCYLWGLLSAAAVGTPVRPVPTFLICREGLWGLAGPVLPVLHSSHSTLFCPDLAQAPLAGEASVCSGAQPGGMLSGPCAASAGRRQSQWSIHFLPFLPVLGGCVPQRSPQRNINNGPLCTLAERENESLPAFLLGSEL